MRINNIFRQLQLGLEMRGKINKLFWIESGIATAANAIGYIGIDRLHESERLARANDLSGAIAVGDDGHELATEMLDRSERATANMKDLVALLKRTARFWTLDCRFAERQCDVFEDLIMVRNADLQMLKALQEASTGKLFTAQEG